MTPVSVDCLFLISKKPIFKDFLRIARKKIFEFQNVLCADGFVSMSQSVSQIISYCCSKASIELKNQRLGWKRP